MMQTRPNTPRQRTIERAHPTREAALAAAKAEFDAKVVEADPPGWRDAVGRAAPERRTPLEQRLRSYAALRTSRAGEPNWRCWRSTEPGATDLIAAAAAAVNWSRVLGSSPGAATTFTSTIEPDAWSTR